jgi:hypothetical protein
MSAPVTLLEGVGVEEVPVVGVGVGVVVELLLPKPPIAMKTPTIIITINRRAKSISSVFRDFFLVGVDGEEGDSVALIFFNKSFFMHFPCFY